MELLVRYDLAALDHHNHRLKEDYGGRIERNALIYACRRTELTTLREGRTPGPLATSEKLTWVK